jgi:hypothetical protein
VVTVAAVKMAAAVYFAVAVVLMLLLMITGFRFHGAYFRAYGGEEGRRRHWLLCGWPMGWRGTRPPPWTLSAWLRPLDDPLVERRRHQYQLAWGGLDRAHRGPGRLPPVRLSVPSITDPRSQTETLPTAGEIGPPKTDTASSMSARPPKRTAVVIEASEPLQRRLVEPIPRPPRRRRSPARRRCTWWPARIALPDGASRAAGWPPAVRLTHRAGDRSRWPRR